MKTTPINPPPDPIDAIEVGDVAELLHTISEEDISAFSRLTGDTNPLHMDDAWAAGTAYKKRVGHGMLTASFISTVIGTKLPGEGSLWYEQSLRFLAPARIGEHIRVAARVTQKSSGQRIVTLETLVFGDDGRKLIEGEAKVKILERAVGEAENTAQETKGAVIVTGGARGIGAAIARALAAAGHPIVVNYLRSKEAADSVVREICAARGRAIAVQADVAEASAAALLVEAATREFGVLKGLVNNASPGLPSIDVGQLRWEELEKHLHVQLKGALLLSQAVLPLLVAQGDGAIVNITSTVVEGTPPLKWSPYTIAKTALASLTRCLAAEYGPRGIRVNSVAPGLVDTDLTVNLSEKTKMLTKMQTPLRRLTQPEDVAGVVAFLFSDGARQITGQTLRVSGGSFMA